MALFEGSDCFYPVVFDEAGMKLNFHDWYLLADEFLQGHRVATQYILSALEGAIPAEHLIHYREANAKLPGHPELGLTPGVKFSSGRLGHMWYVSVLFFPSTWFSYFLTGYLM